MTPTYWKSFGSPDESITVPGAVEDIVELGGMTVGRVVHEPGWRWSTHMKPLVGGESCQAHHVGVVISGRIGFVLDDGSKFELGPEDVYDIPPGHDGYTVGDEPAVLIEWAGLRTFAGPHAGFHSRALVTLLFTDLVDSTKKASELGDTVWRETLARHYQAARAALERFRGRQIVTTGDGLLAVFEGPALALRCAAKIREATRAHGLGIRAGVHVGEVELAGTDVRGIAVHAAARIMSHAEPDEILASEITRTLATGLRFEERGTYELKGVPGLHALYRYVETPD